MSYDHVFKITLVGDSGVGKSVLLSQYTEKRFNPVHDLTIGVEFGTSNETVLAYNIKLQIWDTAGQESFRSITRSYYRDSKGIIIFFDITRRCTFNHIQSWYDEIAHQAGDECIYILVGTKADLEHVRQVSKIEAEKVANSFGMTYCETSAKTTQNVNELFHDIATRICMKNIDVFKGLFYKNNDILEYKIQNEALVNTFNTLNFSTIEYENKKWSQWAKVQQKLKNSLREHKVRLILDLNANVYSDKERMNNVCRFISEISPYVVELETFNYGTTQMYEALLKNAQIRKLRIRACDDTLEVDHRLYGSILKNVDELGLEIDDKLFKAFKDNKDEIWNAFSAALLNNRALKTLHLCVENEDLQVEENVEVFCGILKLIEDNKICQLEFLELLCQETVICTSEATVSTAERIHSSIINCIASKSNIIERIIMKSENVSHSMVNLLNSTFCAQLLNIKFPHLLELNIDFGQSMWHGGNILCLSQFISQTPTLEELSINSNLFLKSVEDAKNKQALALLVYSINCSSLDKILISCFNNIAVKHGLDSFVKLIRSSKAPNIKLSFDDLSINNELYKLLDSWVYHIRQTYNYYKNIKQYIDDSNTLPMFNEKIKTEIFEYIKLETKILTIDAPVYNKDFLVVTYLMDKFEEMLISENFISSATAQTSQQATYMEIVGALNKMISFFMLTSQRNAESCNVFVEEQPLIIENKDDYNELKWNFLSNIDHSALCCGYIREISEYHNMLIPSPIFSSIWQFYPQYKVYEINPDDVDQGYSLQKYKHLSTICDSPYISVYNDNQLLFKPMITNGIWYEIDKDRSVQICEDLNIKCEKYDLLPKNNTYIDIISVPYMGWTRGEASLLFVGGDKGDILLVDNPKEVFLSSEFLLKDKSRMISIRSSSNHALFLTSDGNIFSLGMNDVGQCGMKNEDIKQNNEVYELLNTDTETNKIKSPYHLKDLSQQLIKSIHVGANFSFCVDKNNNLYCFGSNSFNKLGLNDNQCQTNVIWDPIKSDFFSSKSGRIIKQIKCAVNLVVFVDNNGQCYWSGKHFAEINSVSSLLFHWQSFKNEYNNVQIVQALCADEENDDKALVVMIDSQHKLKVELIGTSEPMPYVGIEGLDENTSIDNLLFSLGGVMIVTSKRKLMS